MGLPQLAFSGGTLVFSGASRAQLRQMLGDQSWTWDARDLAWRCDAIQYGVVRSWFQDRKVCVTDTVPKWQAVRWRENHIHQLRSDQQDALNAWWETRQGCIVMPTGTGKTEVALTIMARAATATLVVAPIRDLMHQWHRRILTGLGYDAGIIGDSVFRVKPVSVTTYDSAYLHMDRLGARFQLVVFDECHHLPSPLRQDAAKMCAAPMRLGLTATPERSDGRHADLRWLIGPTVYEMPIAQAKGRTLADYEVVRIPVHLSSEEQSRYDRLSRLVRRYVANRRKADPSFSWDRLYTEPADTPQTRAAVRAYYAKKSIEDRAEEKLRVLEDLFRLHAGEPCLVFAGSNTMARDVSRRFLIPCLLHHCGKTERREILDGLENGTYGAVVANRVLDEGVDVPDVKVAVVIGGTASSRQAKQRLGRILRKSGNAQATLYEVVCAETKETIRSRRRRASDAYAQTRHQRR